LFCFIEAPSKAVVSTLKEPVGGLVNWNVLAAGLMSTGVEEMPDGSCDRWDMRARSDTDEEASGSLFERSRTSA